MERSKIFATSGCAPAVVSYSPALAGAMFGGTFLAGPFIICGALKITYDLLLLFQFRHITPPEEAENP